MPQPGSHSQRQGGTWTSTWGTPWLALKGVRKEANHFVGPLILGAMKVAKASFPPTNWYLQDQLSRHPLSRAMKEGKEYQTTLVHHDFQGKVHLSSKIPIFSSQAGALSRRKPASRFKAGLRAQFREQPEAKVEGCKVWGCQTIHPCAHAKLIAGFLLGWSR